MSASDDDLASAFEALPQQTIVYGHIHTPFIRQPRSSQERCIANAGSVGQPHDGNPRASYLLLDEGSPSIRRVEYNLNRECNALLTSGLPFANWVKRIITTASPQTP